MRTRLWMWILAGLVPAAGIAWLGHLSHRSFSETILESFNAQQSMFTRSLENAVRDHVMEEEQDLQHVIREIARTERGIMAAEEKLPSLYLTHLDNFASIGIYDGEAELLYVAPGEARDTPAMTSLVRRTILANSDRTTAFLSERYIDDDGRTLICLVVPFVLGGEASRYYAAGFLKVEDYMVAHFPSWMGRSMGFVLADGEGDILSMLNTAHVTDQMMKRGNLLELSPSCLECHREGTFDDVRESLRLGDTVHSTIRFPGKGVSTNSSTLVFPVLNELWSISIFSPFASVQRDISRNLRVNVALVALALLLVASLTFMTQKALSLRKAAETAEALRRSEESLRASTVKLEKANLLKNLFTDIVRHDLLSPVAAARGYGELLARGETDEGRRKIFAVMIRSLEKLADTIESAAKISKLQETDGLEVGAIDLARIVDDAVEGVAALLGEKGLRLVRSGAGGPCDMAGGAILEEAFHNLLTNAVKFSPPGGEITVGIGDRGDRWEVSVADRGEGIPDGNKEKVFNRLERLNKEGVKGTGLGLAIVKRVVELHRGTVKVADNPGGGSVFTVSLPKGVPPQEGGRGTAPAR